MLVDELNAEHVFPLTKQIHARSTAQVIDLRPQPLLVGADEAARICGIGRTLFYDLKSAGRLPKPINLGKRRLWKVEELNAWTTARCPRLENWEKIRQEN